MIWLVAGLGLLGWACALVCLLAVAHWVKKADEWRAVARTWERVSEGWRRTAEEYERTVGAPQARIVQEGQTWTTMN